MDNFFQPAPINSGPGHLDRLLATWFESNISLAQVARNLCITFTSLLEYVGRPEVRRAIQQARQLMHERYADTGLELLHEAAQDFKALKGLPENPTPADKDRQRATLNGMRQVAALLAGLTPGRATWPRAARANSAPNHAAHPDPTTPDRALDHSTTSPLPDAPQTLRPLSALFEIVEDPENPDDPTPPNRPKGSRAKSTPTPDAPPAPKKTYPPVEIINYLASSAQHHRTPPESTAPHHALCHLTTSPLLPNYLANSTPDSTTVPEPTAPDRAPDHSTTSPLLPNYLANSTPDSTTVPEPTAPDRSLCHSTTSPLLPNYLANSAPESTTPAQTTAPDRPLCHSTTCMFTIEQTASSARRRD